MKHLFILSATFLFILAFLPRFSAQERPPVPPEGIKKELAPLPALPHRFPLAPEEKRFLTEEEEQEVLHFIEENEPEKLEKLKDLKKFNPMEYREILLHTYKEMRFLKRLKEEDPAKYERVMKERSLERQSHRLARQYRESEDEKEKAKIRNELRNLLYQIFDLRQAHRNDEIKRLEKELSKLKNLNSKRTANKDKIVEQRLQALLGELEGLEW